MWVGLEAEEYDREFSDKALIKRILQYFSPYKRPMGFVVFLLTIASLSSSLIPILTTVVLNNIETNRNVVYIIFVITLTFTDRARLEVLMRMGLRLV